MKHDVPGVRRNLADACGFAALRQRPPGGRRGIRLIFGNYRDHAPLAGRVIGIVARHVADRLYRGAHEDGSPLFGEGVTCSENTAAVSSRQEA